MKHILTLALTCLPLMCFGAPSYTAYFNNVYAYTNVTVGGRAKVLQSLEVTQSAGALDQGFIARPLGYAEVVGAGYDEVIVLNAATDWFNDTGLYMTFDGGNVFPFWIRPEIPATETPYAFGTDLTHTAGNLLHVANNGTNKLTLGFNGTVSAGSGIFTSPYADNATNVAFLVGTTTTWDDSPASRLFFGSQQRYKRIRDKPIRRCLQWKGSGRLLGRPTRAVVRRDS